MNWISIVLILICIAAARSGYRRGFTKTVISMLSFWIIILLISIFNPVLSNAVDEHTDFGKKTKEYCNEKILEYFKGESDPDKLEQINIIEGLPIPSDIKEELLENNNLVVYNILEVTNFFEYIAAFLSKLILRAVVFLISIALAWALVRLGGWCIEGIVSMPGLNVLNRLAGAMAGMIKGLVIIWILFLVLVFVSGSGVGAFLVEQIQKDAIGNILYQKNPLLWLLIVFFVF